MKRRGVLAAVLAASAAFGSAQLLACSRCAQQRSAVPSTAPLDARADEVVPVGGRAEPEIQTAEGRSDARAAANPMSPFLEEAPADEVDEPRDLPGSAQDTARIRGASADEPRRGTPIWPPEDYVDGSDEADEIPKPDPLPVPGTPQDAGIDARNPIDDAPVQPDPILDAGTPTPSK